VSDDQPVKPKVTYAVQVDGLEHAISVTCDDVREEGGYIRFYDGEIPAAILPVGRLVAAAVTA